SCDARSVLRWWSGTGRLPRGRGRRCAPAYRTGYAPDQWSRIGPLSLTAPVQPRTRGTAGGGGGGGGYATGCGGGGGGGGGAANNQVRLATTLFELVLPLYVLLGNV